MDISKKKWTHNPYTHSPSEFFNNFYKATVSPWVDENKPANFSRILDADGDRLGIPRTWHFSWAQLH